MQPTEIAMGGEGRIKDDSIPNVNFGTGRSLVGGIICLLLLKNSRSVRFSLIGCFLLFPTNDQEYGSNQLERLAVCSTISLLVFYYDIEVYRGFHASRFEPKSCPRRPATSGYASVFIHPARTRVQHGLRSNSYNALKFYIPSPRNLG